MPVDDVGDAAEATCHADRTGGLCIEIDKHDAVGPEEPSQPCLPSASPHLSDDRCRYLQRSACRVDPLEQVHDATLPSVKGDQRARVETETPAHAPS